MNEILDFTYRPEINKKKAVNLFVGLLLLSAVFVVISVFVSRYKGLISLAAVIGITLALAVYNRFLAGVYAYIVMTDSSGTPLFLVTRTVGRSVSTLCRVELADVVGMSLLQKDKKSDDGSKGRKKMNFCPSVSPSAVYVLETKNRYEHFEILLEGSEEFAQRILEYAEIAKRLKQEAEDAEEY